MKSESQRTAPDVGVERKTLEWKATLVAAISGLFLFLSVSGVSIYFFPFSITNQFMVLFHTGLGLVFAIPYVAYQWRHYRYSRSFNLTDTKVLGYSSFVCMAACVISGLVLTWQPIFGTKISYGWDLVHTVSGLVAIPLILSHIIILIARYTVRSANGQSAPLRQGISRFSAASAMIGVVCLTVTVLAAYAYAPVTFTNEFPAGYDYKYGDDVPFRPSLATTTTGGAFDSRSMAESQTCGVEGCHEQIYKEWLPSAHRYASMDPAFQKVQATMAKNNGPASTRYCAGCHDPIALFSGAKHVYSEDLSSYGADEGVSCVACHSVVSTDVKGNASYVIGQPERYIYELKEGSMAQFMSNFLIRAYPRHHVATFTKEFYKTPEYCGACHKQFIDEEINQVGWVQLQNQYDNWKNSRWYTEGDPTKTITCRECHMSLYASTDPASGDESDYNRHGSDNMHRNHRFIGANQFIPGVLDLPGGKEHTRLVEAWLRGDIEIPEIADKWTEGPTIPLEIIAPQTVVAGEEVQIKVSMLNNKAGHDFPTGPLDIIQVWVDLTVEDQDGNVIYRSGELDDRHFIQEGSFVFKAEGIDQYGNLIDRHNLWEMVGARFKRALFPGFSDVAEYEFMCPSVIRRSPENIEGGQQFKVQIPDNYSGAIHVSAKLYYRKVTQFLVNFLFGEESGLTAFVSEISSDTATVWVE